MYKQPRLYNQKTAVNRVVNHFCITQCVQTSDKGHKSKSCGTTLKNDVQSYIYLNC